MDKVRKSGGLTGPRTDHGRTVQDRIALIWRTKRAEVRDLLKKDPELTYRQIAELLHVSLSFVNVTVRMYGIRRYKKAANNLH